MLAIMGESGVSAETTAHPSVQTATSILATEDYDFQLRGWWFNKETNLTLVQNNSGEVVLPTGTMEMTVSGVGAASPAEKSRYVMRGNRMYDSVGHTYNIGRPVVVNLVVQQPVTDLPAAAANYLLHKAGLAMYLDDDGDTFKTEKLEQRVASAWQKLMASHMKIVSANALDSPSARAVRAGYPTGSGTNPTLIGG